MAELDFKHNVQQIPAGAQPEVYKRTVSSEASHVPDYQGTFARYAADMNWMSELGSSVAAKASNAIATKLGGEVGKNPHGDLMPSFTDFDKAFSEAYQVQAQSTLGLQANKLITDSNIETAKAVRITPELIAQTNKQLTLGLQSIFKNAPTEIRPRLEGQYGSLMLQQNEQLATRMLREQKEDRQNILDLSAKKNSQNAYSLQLSGMDLDVNGDSKSALIAEQAVKKSYDSAVKMKDKTPLERQVAIDSARQSRLSAKYIRLALIAQKEGKEGDFLKNLSDNPPKDVNAADHNAVYNNILSYINNQKALRAEDENLKSQNMYNRIITNPDISGAEWAAFEESVSPLKAAQMKFHLIQQRNKKRSGELATNDLIAHYEDPRVQANASPEQKNAAFNRSVDNVLQKNPNISRDEAEMQVASSAGATVPVFTKTLQNGLWSGDAAQMVAKARQIDELQLIGSGHALTDLSDSDLAIASDISHNNNPADPAWAARMVTENRENQDPAIRKASDAAFSNYLYENATKNNTTADDFILKKFNLQGGMFHTGFDSPWMKGAYATDIMTVFRTNFINTRRDVVRAETMTQEYIKNNYGKTQFNGSSEFTKHPIEKAIGFNEGEGIPSIQKDLVRQVSVPLAKLKEDYDAKKSDTYWSIEGFKENVKLSQAKNIASYIGRNESKFERLKFVKHTRNGISTDTESYPLKLVGNSFNLELNVETAHGPMSIFLAAPEIGVHKYTPDIKWIKDDYLGKHNDG